MVKAASEVDRKPCASNAIKEDFPVHRGVETARFPGCLKIESEERETWTAESLRAAFMIEACFDRKKRSRKRIRRFTFKVHRWPKGQCMDLVKDVEAQGIRSLCHCAKRVISRDQNLIQLESLILAQSERWRQA